jgi:hypothetical protein
MQNSTNFYSDNQTKKNKNKQVREDSTRSLEEKNKQKELKKAREFKRFTWE